MAKRVVGYFENWAQYRQSGGKFLPAQINPGFFTHINFAFGLIGFVTWSVDPSPTRTGSQRYTGDYTVQPVEWNDQTVLYPAIQALKQRNGSLKTLLSIGGWSMNSCDDTPNSGNPHPYGPFTCQLFSKMAADPQGRSQFINSAIGYARKYGFDGIDIDWEYPGYVGRGGGPNDLANFLALVQEFRAAAGPNFLFTMASPAIVPTGLPQTYHDNPSTYFQWLQQCSQSFDWLNVMSYDYHGAFDDPVKVGTGVNSPLPQDSTPNGPFSIKQTVDTYLAAGIPTDKMVLGMPTYGRAYTVANPSQLATDSSYGQPFSGPAPAGPATQVPGVLAYYEVAQQIASGSLTQKWDAATLTPYAYNSTSGEWVSYDNPDSVAYKTAYVNAMGLGGVMIWSIDDDDFANGYPLLTKIKDILDHPENGPQLPGGMTSQINFPLDLLGIFTSDWSNQPMARTKLLCDGTPERASAEVAAGSAVALSGTPAMVTYYDEVWLFHEGAGEDGELRYATYDLKTNSWSADSAVPNSNNGITGPPALAVYDDQIYCVREGAGQSGQLYYCTFDAATQQWTDDLPVPIGAQMAGSTRHNYPSIALAEYNGNLHCVFEGGTTRGGGQLWHSIFSADTGQWSVAGRVGDFGTANGPGLVVIGNKLSCWHEGAFQDGQLWVTNFDGNTWSADSKINVSTSGPPALAVVTGLNTSKLYGIHEGPFQSGVLYSFNNTLFQDKPLNTGSLVRAGGALPIGADLENVVGRQLESHGTPAIAVWRPGVVGGVGEQLAAKGKGNGTAYSGTIEVETDEEEGGFDLRIDARATAPYDALPVYSRDLRSSAPTNNAQNQYPVSATRHHIVPHNLLVDFWNYMLSQGDMAADSGGSADSLLSTLASTINNYQTTMHPVDRVAVQVLILKIRLGIIRHNPDGVKPDAMDNLAQVYEWLPGNLFVGPVGSLRSDDPGGGFETGVLVVVGGNFFNKLLAADLTITAYLNSLGRSPISAAGNLTQIARRRGSFDLNADNWVLSNGLYRLSTINQLNASPDEKIKASTTGEVLAPV